MTNTEQKPRRWAPWWAYVVPIIGANLLKQQALGDAPVAVNVAVTVALVAVLVAAITAGYRLLGRS
jgi:hypothetical protein